MSWRYQPVIIGEGEDAVVVLCEVYFDKNGKLEMWTQEPRMSPQGSDVLELSGDLMRMYVDTLSWFPEPFDNLHIGMTFTPAVTMEDRNALADAFAEIGGGMDAKRRRLI